MSRPKPHNFTTRRHPSDSIPASSAQAASSDPTREKIAIRAYEIYLARGGEPGRAEEDWYQAERELQLGRQ